MLHAPCWHSQWSSSEQSSQLCQKKLRLKRWELSEQSTRTPRWKFSTEDLKAKPLKSYFSSSCCQHPLPASGKLWMADWGYHTRSHAVCRALWLQRTFTRRSREQRACLPPKRVCAGEADLDGPLAGNPWAFSGRTQPKVHLLFLRVFPFRAMPLVLSSISCFLSWQLLCSLRHTATALSSLAPVFATSVPREIPGPKCSWASRWGLLCACLLHWAPTVHTGALCWLFLFIQDYLHPPTLGTEVAWEH